MEMPENCFKCPAHEWYDFGGKNHGYQCPILRTTKAISNCEARTKRRDDCPLVPVPPHGRLIDADALVDKHFGKEYLSKIMTADKDDMGTALVNIPLVINNAPTIIPASEEGET